MTVAEVAEVAEVAAGGRGFGGFGWAVFGVVVGALLVLAAVASKMKGPRE